MPATMGNVVLALDPQGPIGMTNSWLLSATPIAMTAETSAYDVVTLRKVMQAMCPHLGASER